MARTNRNFGRLNAETGEIEYAPTSLTIGGRLVMNPQAAHYAQAGYLPVENAAPSEPAPDGYHYEARGYDEDESRIWRVYETVANPPAPPRTFSKLKCVAALMEAGLWGTVKGYIEQAGLYDLYLAAQDFREDNEYFVRGEAALMESLSLTDNQVEAILQKCVSEGV